MGATTRTYESSIGRTETIILWTVQALLAALFLFAGGMKLLVPSDQLQAGAPIHFSAAFIHFIGSCEVLGALGLVLPRATRVLPELTPIAAAGLVIIMIGAVTVTLAGGMGVAAAILPFVVGVLAALVAWRRWTGFRA